MDFDTCFARLIGNEGGYVNDPRDPGGETNFGISKRQYPAEDIAGMTLNRAKAIYLHDYWGAAGCPQTPENLRFEVFDIAVNQGPVRAIQLLQAAVGAVPDGVFGPETQRKLQCVAAENWPLRRLWALRLKSYTKLKDFVAFGPGWVNRVANNMLEA